MADSGNRATSLQAPSSWSLPKPVSPALPLTSYMSLGKSCLSPWASVSLTENERRVLEVYDCDPLPRAGRPHVTWGEGKRWRFGTRSQPRTRPRVRSRKGLQDSHPSPFFSTAFRGTRSAVQGSRAPNRHSIKVRRARPARQP